MQIRFQVINPLKQSNVNFNSVPIHNRVSANCPRTIMKVMNDNMTVVFITGKSIHQIKVDFSRSTFNRTSDDIALQIVALPCKLFTQCLVFTEP